MTETFDVQTVIQTIIDSKTDEERAEWEKAQARERAKFSVRMDTVKQNAIYGQRAVELADNALKNPNLSAEQREFETERRAEGLALMGNLDEAIEIAVQKKDEYLAKRDAMTNAPCLHGQSFLKERFLYNGREYGLYECPVCRILTV